MKVWKRIKLVLFCLLAVLVIVGRHFFVENLKYLIGPLLILYGGEEILLHVVRRHRLHEPNEFFYGAVQVLLGLVVLIAFDNVVESTHYIIICTIWATWALLREAIEIEEAVHKLFARKYIALPNLAESAVNIVFSISLLISPGEHHALIHCWLLAIELLTAVLFPLIEEIAERLKTKEK